MSVRRATLLNSHIRILLRMLPTSSANAKLRIWSITQGIGISSHQFVSSFHSCIPSKPKSHFLCKSSLFGNIKDRTIPPFLQNPKLSLPRWSSTSSNEQSFTVSYLVNSIGLSPKIALSVSKHLDFKSSEKPEKVVNLFEKYGFTRIQISSIVRGNPKVLTYDAEKNILPKLEFFEAKGILAPGMAKMLSTFPRILSASLEKQIMPSYDYFKKLFQSDETLTKAIRRCPDMLTHNIDKYVLPKIDILREHGVPDSGVAKMVLYRPRVFMLSLDRFSEILEKVVEMGFVASKLTFVLAVSAFRSLSKSNWQNKIDAYKKCGWSEEEVLEAFQRNPWCMMISEDKLMAGTAFFINEFGSKPCLIAKRPILLLLSLKKRLIPRSSVFQVLLSKGLVKKEVSLTLLFETSEKKFLQKFVTPYEKEAPELMKLYEEKLKLSNAVLVDKV